MSAFQSSLHAREVPNLDQAEILRIPGGKSPGFGLNAFWESAPNWGFIAKHGGGRIVRAHSPGSLDPWEIP